MFFFSEIIRAVKKENQETPFRPPVDNLGAADYIIKCMKACWYEEPELRPDIRYVRVRLKEMQVSATEIEIVDFQFCKDSNFTESVKLLRFPNVI